MGKFRRRHHLMHHKCGDQKSVNSVESNESMRYLDVPMNLSSTDGKLMKSFMKKFNEVRAMPQINFIRTDLPEQTEPEDLSMHSPKSPVSMDELEELEDAATLYLKLSQNRKMQKNLRGDDNDDDC